MTIVPSFPRKREPSDSRRTTPWSPLSGRGRLWQVPLSSRCVRVESPRRHEHRSREHDRDRRHDLRRRLHVPPRALPVDVAAAHRPLLPLPLVPARIRRRIRAECADRGRPRALAGRRCRDRRHAVGERQGAEDRPLPAMQDRRVEQLRGRGRVGALRARRHAGRPRPVPPDIHIFTASKQPWVALPPDTPAVADTTTRSRCGRRRVSRAGPRCARARRPRRRDAPMKNAAWPAAFLGLCDVRRVTSRRLPCNPPRP